MRRIEEQLGARFRLIEKDRYGIDVLAEIAAVRMALHTLEAQVPPDGVSRGTAMAFSPVNATEQRQKVHGRVEAIGGVYGRKPVIRAKGDDGDPIRLPSIRVRRGN
ncbi:MAG: metal-sensing transcriptional repressor [Rhodospirillales bacterium]|nr:metal-sensing transcriptional repressor [Rhodospirillales bacterium]